MQLSLTKSDKLHKTRTLKKQELDLQVADARLTMLSCNVVSLVHNVEVRSAGNV